MNHPTLSSIVSDGDRQALQSLLNVAVEDEPDLRSGYGLLSQHWLIFTTCIAAILSQ